MHGPVFDEGVRFIHECVQGGGRCVVHCMLGFNRSPAMVLAYIVSLKKYGTVDDCLELVHKMRPCANPGSWFVKQIRTWVGLGVAPPNPPPEVAPRTSSVVI